jgi:hypothetical protein
MMQEFDGPHDDCQNPDAHVHRIVDRRDLEAGLAAKESGTEAVLAATPAEWKKAFRIEAERLAATGREFTAEDVTEVVGLPASVNAIGAAMNALARAGTVARVGSTMATRSLRHASRITVWKGVRVLPRGVPSGPPCFTCGRRPDFAYDNGSPGYRCRHDKGLFDDDPEATEAAEA